MDDKLKAFIEELSQLTNKYDIEIASCGCCSSPYMLGLDAEFHILAENLKFDRDIRTYSIEMPEMPSAYQYDGIMFNADGTECERFDSELSEEEMDAMFSDAKKAMDSFRDFNKSGIYQEVCMVAGEVFSARTDENGELYIKVFNKNAKSLEAYFRLDLDKTVTFIRSTYPDEAKAALTKLLSKQLKFIIDWAES